MATRVVVGVLTLLALTACGGISGVVEVKSDGVDMWSCPIRPNNWALYLKRDGDFDGNRSGICVTEETWKKYNVGDQYP